MPIMFYIAKVFYWAFYAMVGIGLTCILCWHFGEKQGLKKTKKTRKFKGNSIYNQIHQTNLKEPELRIERAKALLFLREQTQEMLLDGERQKKTREDRVALANVSQAETQGVFQPFPEREDVE